MSTVIDYTNWNVHITSPQTAVIVQDLLNDIRTFEADQTGIAHPVIIEASGKAQLSAGVQVGITMQLINPWQLEFYAGDYRATIEGGNVTTDRPDGNVIAFVSGGPQIEILRSAAATIVTNGGSIPTAEQNAAAVGARVVEGALTANDLLRLGAAIKHGAGTVPDTGSFVFKSADGSKTRVAGSVDANGVRVITTLDGS